MLGMTNGEVVARAQQRVGDVEREAAVERLRNAAGEGRLTLDELDGRLEAALVARTFADLEVLTADLPDTRPATLRPDKESVRLAVRHGKIERVGAWHIPRTVTLELAHAVATLDLRHSPLPADGLRLEVEARHSVIHLLVPAGMLIETDELVRRHSNLTDRRGRRVAEWSGPQVCVTGSLAHCTLKIKRPR
jgi:hypothetical protein